MSGIAIRFRDKILSDSNLIRILIKDSNERVTLFLWIRAVRIIIIDSTLETFLSIDRGVVKRWSTVSKSSVSSSWQEFRRFRVPSAVSQPLVGLQTTNGVDDFLRLPARHTVTETRQFCNFQPPPPAKMARGGDVPNFDNCVTIRRIENIYGIVRID